MTEVVARFPPKLKAAFQKARYKVLYGGRGCIHPDTPIETPDGLVRAGDFQGGPVISFDGNSRVIAYAGPAVFYPPEDLYKVSFSNGESISVTGKHRFLAPSGWVEAGSLRDGDLILQPQQQSASDQYLKCCAASQSGYVANAPHCLRTLAGFLWSYFAGCHPSDVRPLTDQDTVRDVAQLLVDARPRKSHAWMRLDDPGLSDTSNPSRLSRHLSSLVSHVAEVAQSSEAMESCSDDRSSELLLEFSRSSQRFHERSTHFEQVQGIAELYLSACNLLDQCGSLQKVFGTHALSVDDSSYSSQVSCNHDRIIKLSVVSVNHIGLSEYCDFFVPFFNSYIAAGVINHNSGKSWSIARALLIQGAQETLRVLCTREVQKSIKESVHRLLTDQIANLGLSSFYTVLDTEIRGANGSLFVFAGLQQHTVDSIKSYEGVDRVWIEEAHGVSKKSWDVLIPTIRKPGSEIWISFNPELDTDEVYKRFVINTPPNTVLIEMNWRDNQFWSDELEFERLHSQQTAPDDYEQIWEGKCRSAVVGAIYAKEVEAALREQRVTTCPYDPKLKVHAVWDLGWNDSMAIALCQKVRSELRVIKYIEDSHRTLDSYVAELKQLRYNWGYDYLPHDGYHGDYKTGKTAEEILKAFGRKVKPTPKTSIENGIKAARMALGSMVFNKPETERLVECIKRYRREISKNGEPGSPVHDEYSHGADALRYVALCAERMTNEDETEQSVVIDAFSPYDSDMGY